MMKKSLALLLTLSFVSAGLSDALAEGKKVCIFTGADGKTQQVASPQSIPEKYRKGAQCFESKDGDFSGHLSAPQEVTLEGSQRTEDMNTSIGRVHLRWERKAEKLFGRTPVRAMTDAASTVSRVIKNSAFPTKVQSLSQEWNVVFLGDKLPPGQIPVNLITNCHPGWMTPPANIYIVADRVAGGCGSVHSTTSVADSTLTEVLLHEMGHAIEFQLLGQNDPAHDRMRAEGFATFFAMYAARSSSVVSARELEERNTAYARQAVMASPAAFMFSGTAQDYARAAMYFATVENKLGLREVVKVYETISTKNVDFFSALKLTTGWDEHRREKEVQDALKISLQK